MATEGPSSPPSAGISDLEFQSPHPASPHSALKDNLHPLSAPPLSSGYNYNFSSTVYDESSAPPTDAENDYTTTDEEAPGHPYPGAATTSSRSSISSLPVSVAPSAHINPSDKPETPTRNIEGHHARSGSAYRYLGPRAGGLYDHSPFRNPSSVRAMQMGDEGDGGRDFTPLHRRRDSRMSADRLSTFSVRSSNSTTSPTKKRGAQRSSHSVSPQKTMSSSKLKNEHPLVLLHCTILEPYLGLQVRVKDPVLLREVLPEKYWRRWKTLGDKVAKNGEVMQRGVLIPHPKGDYEILEEKLLESLELERPRVRQGHFLGSPQSENEIDETKDTETEAAHSARCIDCGGDVTFDVEAERKWEIKVYAANGLMRAGAWSAAWAEMEKVDVEVGVWMPEEVRREVEARLNELGFGEDDEDMEPSDSAESEEERRRREVYGSSSPQSQEKIDGLFDEEIYPSHRRQEAEQERSTPTHQPASDLQAVITYNLKVLTQDKRNIVIVLLSLLVLSFSMAPVGNRNSLEHREPLNPIAKVETTTISVTPTPSSLPECDFVKSSVTSEEICTDKSTVEAARPSQTAEMEAKTPQNIAAPEADNISPIVAEL